MLTASSVEGLAEITLCVMLFGTMFVPVKKFHPGDGKLQNNVNYGFQMTSIHVPILIRFRYVCSVDDVLGHTSGWLLLLHLGRHASVLPSGDGRWSVVVHRYVSASYYGLSLFGFPKYIPGVSSQFSAFSKAPVSLG